MDTKKFLWIAVALGVVFSFGTVAVQAAPIQFSEQNGIDSVWKRFDAYTFSGSDLLLSPGKYDLMFNINGVAWQRGGDSHGWDPTDEIFIEAILNDNLLASY